MPQSLRGRETVFLVEDAGALRAVVRQILDRNGYAVLGAPDGRSALDDAIIRHGSLEPGIAFLQKPFSPEMLARKVRQVLDAP
jgi:DNA-binding response OmpR family regulator